MEYEWLYKIKFSQRAKYDAEYKKRYDSISTYHYNFNVGKYQAFVVVNTEILQLISKIQSLDKELFSLESSLPRLALQQYYQKCLIDEVQQTNELEGVASTRKEIKDVLDKKETNSRLIGIVQKYQLLSTTDTISLSNCYDIRSLYNELVMDEVQENDPENIPDGDIFRKGSVYVRNKDTGEVIHTGLYPETAIIQTITSLLSILNNPQYNTLINIALIHYMFGYIHPFYDGNGRMSRFISSYLLSRELEQIVGYRLAYTIKKDTRKYYKMFKLTNEDSNLGDLTPFTIYFLELVADLLTDLTRHFKDQLEKLCYYENKIKNSDLPNDCVDMAFVMVQNALFAYEGLSISFLKGLYHKSDGKIRSMIDILEKRGFLKVVKKRPYLYSANLDMISEVL